MFEKQPIPQIKTSPTMNVIEFLSWSFVLLCFNKNCKPTNFKCVLLMTSQSQLPFAFQIAVYLTLFCYWFLIKFLKRYLLSGFIASNYLACSQTLYFLFKVRRARVIKYKPQGIYACSHRRTENPCFCGNHARLCLPGIISNLIQLLIIMAH